MYGLRLYFSIPENTVPNVRPPDSDPTPIYPLHTSLSFVCFCTPRVAFLHTCRDGNSSSLFCRKDAGAYREWRPPGLFIDQAIRTRRAGRAGSSSKLLTRIRAMAPAERRGQVQVRDMQPPHFDSVLIFGLVMSAASAASVASASAAPAGRFPVRLRPLSTAGK